MGEWGIELRTKVGSGEENLNFSRFGIFENILITHRVAGHHLLRLDTDLLLTLSFGLSLFLALVFVFCLNCLGFTPLNYLK